MFIHIIKIMREFFNIIIRIFLQLPTSTLFANDLSMCTYKHEKTFLQNKHKHILLNVINDYVRLSHIKISLIETAHLFRVEYYLLL